MLLRSLFERDIGDENQRKRAVLLMYHYGDQPVVDGLKHQRTLLFIRTKQARNAPLELTHPIADVAARADCLVNGENQIPLFINFCPDLF